MTIDTTPYRHFSFDLWLTLIRSNPQYKKKRDQLLQAYFSIDTDPGKVSQVIRYYDLLCNRLSEKLGIHITVQQIYYQILCRLGVNIDAIDTQQLDNFYQETEQLFMQYKPLLIDPKISQLLHRIQSEGKTASILSNTAFIKGSTLRSLLEQYELGQYFSFQLYSDELGQAKPHPTAFQQVLIQAQAVHQPHISPDQIVHIGDNKTADYDGAISAGMHALLIQHKSDEKALQPA